MHSNKKYRTVKIAVEGDLFRGDVRMAKIRCTFDDVQEFIVVDSLGGGPEELPDPLHDFRNGHMEIVEGGGDLEIIEDLVLALSSGERWRVRVEKNEIFGKVDWEVHYLSVL